MSIKLSSYHLYHLSITYHLSTSLSPMFLWLLLLPTMDTSLPMLPEVLHERVNDNLQIQLPLGICKFCSLFSDRFFHWALYVLQITCLYTFLLPWGTLLLPLTLFVCFLLLASCWHFHWDHCHSELLETLYGRVV